MKVSENSYKHQFYAVMTLLLQGMEWKWIIPSACFAA